MMAISTPAQLTACQPAALAMLAATVLCGLNIAQAPIAPAGCPEGPLPGEASATSFEGRVLTSTPRPHRLIRSVQIRCPALLFPFFPSLSLPINHQPTKHQVRPVLRYPSLFSQLPPTAGLSHDPL